MDFCECAAGKRIRCDVAETSDAIVPDVLGQRSARNAANAAHARVYDIDDREPLPGDPDVTAPEWSPVRCRA
jgi:hypothetical protein